MKKCTKCGTIYDNCWSKCIHCNHKEYTKIETEEKLKNIINEENEEKLIEEKKNNKEDKLTKKLIIGLIELFFGAILMYIAFKRMNG